jgi:hypothetical protein
MNLGLPIAPSQRNDKIYNTQEETGVDLLKNYFTSNANVDRSTGPPIRTDTPTQDYGKPGLLFPLEARVQGLDDKLVQQALTKSLTAEALAKHLEGSIFSWAGPNVSPQTPASRSNGSVETVTPSRLQATYDQGIFRPPPGLVMPQHPHLNMRLHSLQDFMQPQQQFFSPPAAPRAMMDMTCQESATPHTVPMHMSLHTRMSSYEQSYNTKSTPRRRRVSDRGKFLTRQKRMDQGPEPSEADIYPEDAMAQDWHYDEGVYRERRPLPQGIMMRQPSSSLPVNLQVGDATAWPTPAEAKIEKPTPATPALVYVTPPAQFSPSNTYRPTENTEEEYHTVSPVATETNVSSPSVAALVSRAGTDGLPSDVRPLTPGQIDGTRYGLRMFGIGINDSWEPPAIHSSRSNRVDLSRETLSEWDAVPFRVRPRLHDGWGSWEWAHRIGWYNDEWN